MKKFVRADYRRFLMSKFFVAFLIFSIVLPVAAFETDQYNLSPEPLADTGVEVSEHLREALVLTAAELNAEIEALEKCSNDCPETAKRNTMLAELRQPETLAQRFYDRIAGGALMTTKFGKWINGHEFGSQPARYRVGYTKSIFVLNPFNFATLSPTVKVFGHELGVDKLEHLLQQGYQYYEIYERALGKGESKGKARQKAIEWGKKTERTYYGLLSSGVYSNADLFANYAGWKFYTGLTENLSIGELRRPAMFSIKGGRWQMNTAPTSSELLLKPFIGDHMNEALNPSAFRLTLVRSVRRAIRDHACDDWRLLRPEFTSGKLKQLRKELKTWHGEDYGWTQRSRTVALDEVCVED